MFCVLCFVFCVLCFVFCVLCFVFCVLYFVFCVFCSVFRALCFGEPVIRGAFADSSWSPMVWGARIMDRLEGSLFLLEIFVIL
ncbi:hypothetical protein C7121_14785 [Paenibacillus glucanolyticus]|nr:hypothetical protein C7121_14785 [Paenibacillus glucanolyticus]